VDYLADKHQRIREANLSIVQKTLARTYVPSDMIPRGLIEEVAASIRKDYSDTRDLAWRTAAAFSITVDDETVMRELTQAARQKCLSAAATPSAEMVFAYALLHLQYEEPIVTLEDLLRFKEDVVRCASLSSKADVVEAGLWLFAVALTTVPDGVLAQNNIRAAVEETVLPLLDHSSIAVRVAAGHCLAVGYEAYWRVRGFRIKEQADRAGGIELKRQPSAKSLQHLEEDDGDDQYDDDADYDEDANEDDEDEDEDEDDFEEDKWQGRRTAAGEHVNEALLDRLIGLLRDSGRGKSKDDRKIQRRVFRHVFDTVEGYASADNEEVVTIYGVSIRLNTWSRAIHWWLISHFLGEGLPNHVQRNPFIHSLFSLSTSDVAMLSAPQRSKRDKTQKFSRSRDRRNPGSMESWS
jgi:hypothetical protein